MSDHKKLGEIKKDEEKPQLGVPKPQEVFFFLFFPFDYFLHFIILFSIIILQSNNKNTQVLGQQQPQSP